MEIALLRHGKPEAISAVPLYAFQFPDWIAGYNNCGIAKESVPSKAALEYASKCGVLVSSDLPRSVQSAELLCGDNHDAPDNLFTEAGMPCAEWHALKLPPGYWAVLFRMLWYLGYSKNSESYSDARKRAVLAAHKLIGLAKTRQSVLLAGHGIFNSLIDSELKCLGWSGPRNPGSNYWDYRIYTKRQ